MMNSRKEKKWLLFGGVVMSTFVGYKLWKKVCARRYYESTSILEDSQLILTSSAPGKIILSGEHGVVHGVTALATAIDKRTKISLYEKLKLGTSLALGIA